MRTDPAVLPAASALPMRRRRALVALARFLSTVCNPFVMTLVLFAVLAHTFAGDAETFWKWLFITTFFTSLAPLVLVFWLYSTGRISDLDMSNRTEREKVFIWFVAIYMLGTIILFALGAPRMMVATMAGYTAATFVLMVITRFWKISTHAMGITSPMVVMVALYGAQPLPFLVLIPLVCWARVYLRAHTLLQVIAGSALGFVSVFVFFKLFGLL